MKSANLFIYNRRKDRPTLLALCLLVSILLHLAFILFLYTRDLTSEPPLTQQPTIVKLVDKPPQIKPKELELDQQPIKPTPEPPPESSRLAEQNQRVEKETAPKGDDTRDQAASAKSVQPAQAPPTPPVTAKPNKGSRPENSKSSQGMPTEASTQPSRQAEQELTTEQMPEQQPLPSLNQLTQLSDNTVGRIIQKEQSRQERIKERADLETGDTVWLNLERGLLISFFRRFRNQIEGVWNYPREAIEKEMQGTLLLKITVNHDGELVDVDLLESSGSEILDYEAIQAVYRAAPFGPLGKHYPYPDLKIMAHFRYQISGKYIYGQRR